MKKQIYLAGALGCYDPTDKYPYQWRKEARAYMENYEDFICFNPALYYNYNEELQHTEKEIMKFELRILKKSTAILVNLMDLDKSIGTSDEILYAYLNDIPVIGFYDGDISDIHPWKIEQIDRIETGDDAMKHAINYIASYYG